MQTFADPHLVMFAALATANFMSFGPVRTRVVHGLRRCRARSDLESITYVRTLAGIGCGILILALGLEAFIIAQMKRGNMAWPIGYYLAVFIAFAHAAYSTALAAILQRLTSAVERERTVASRASKSD